MKDLDNIVIDFDDVLCDTEEHFDKWCCLHTGKRSYEIKAQPNFLDHFTDYATSDESLNADIILGANTMLLGLHNVVGVHLATARQNKNAEKMMEWLYNYNMIHFFKSISALGDYDKSRLCDKVDAKVLFDDSPHNLNCVQHLNLKPVLFDRPYNQRCRDFLRINHLPNFAKYIISGEYKK